MGKNRINTVLIIFVLINIIGEVGNVAFWFASESSRGTSLNTSLLANYLGVGSALFAASAILTVVALIYAISLFGLFKAQKWAPLLVVGISIINRILALLIYFISPAFAFWAVWTAILIVFSYIDYQKLTPTPTSQQSTA